MKTKPKTTPLLQQLLELRSRLEVIETRMNACIAGQKRIRDLI